MVDKGVGFWGTITISTNVSGASIKVLSGADIVATGTAVTTAATIENIPNGDYTVIVSKEGYKDAATTVKVEGNVTVNVTLEEEAAVKITSNSLKTFEITFNKAVKADTLTNENLKIYLGDNTAPLVKDINYNLITSADKKVVKVVLLQGSYTQQTKYKVVMKGVTTSDSEAFPAVDETITLTDTKAPEVTAAQFISKKTLKITFDEAVNVSASITFTLLDELKINGEKVLVTRAAADNKDNSVTYTLDAAIQTGNYEITVEGISDYAGWKSAKKTISASYTVRTEAPKIVSATATQKNLVHVTFDAPLQEAGTVTINDATATIGTDETNDSAAAINDAAADGLKYVKKSETQYDFYLGTSKYLSTAAIIEQKITYNGLKDLDENEVKEIQTFTFQAENDTVLPSVDKYEVDGKTVSLTFSEAVNATDAQVTGNYTFTTADSAKTFHPNSATYNQDTKKVILTFLDSDVTEAGGTFKLTVKNIKDFSVRDNQMKDYTTNVVFKDTKAPAVSSVLAKQGDGSNKEAQLIITFDKEMDKSSIGDLTNYTYYDADKNSGTSIKLSAWNENGKKATAVVSDDKKSVTITLGDWIKKDAIDINNDKITVNDVKDSNGNEHKDFTTKKDLELFNETVNQNVISSIEATGKRTLVVTLKDDASAFSSVNANDFKFKDLDNVTAVKASLAADKKSVTLDLNTDINVDGTISNNNSNVKVYTVDDTKITNVAGQKLIINSSNAVAVTDKIAPSILKVESEGTGNENKIGVTFDEKVNATGNKVENDLVIMVDGKALEVAEGDFEVADVSNSVIMTITIKKPGVKSSNVTVELKNGRYVKDGSGNKANIKAAQKVALQNGEFVREKENPISNIDTNETCSNKTVTLKFTEKLQLNAGDVKEYFEFTDNSSGNVDFESVVYDNKNNTVTFILNGNAEDNDTIEINSRKNIFDMVNNEAFIGKERGKKLKFSNSSWSIQ